MDGKMLARLGAVVFVGVAITAAVIEFTRQPEPAEVGRQARQIDEQVQTDEEDAAQLP